MHPTEDTATVASLPLWERGLKFVRILGTDISIIVAPLVGAWIEISSLSDIQSSVGSLPLWERGLKFKYAESLRNQAKVAPLVGAWIEISRVA